MPLRYRPATEHVLVARGLKRVSGTLGKTELSRAAVAFITLANQCFRYI